MNSSVARLNRMSLDSALKTSIAAPFSCVKKEGQDVVAVEEVLKSLWRCLEEDLKVVIFYFVKCLVNIALFIV